MSLSNPSQPPRLDPELARRNRRTGLMVLGVIVLMLVLSFLARVQMMPAIFKL